MAAKRAVHAGVKPVSLEAPSSAASHNGGRKLQGRQSMSKTIALTIAVTAFAGLVAIIPAQAATRSVDISIERFADRCVEQGGALADANPSFSCETPDTVVACSFYTINYAECEWAGIENQLAVNRLIGMPDS